MVYIIGRSANSQNSSPCIQGLGTRDAVLIGSRSFHIVMSTISCQNIEAQGCTRPMWRRRYVV